MKTVLITGASGFIGRNLRATLSYRSDLKILSYDVDNESERLSEMLLEADFIFHLAGVNRPITNDEFKFGNVELTQKITNFLLDNKKQIPFIFSSSVQAEQNNPYGISKKDAEDSVFNYGHKSDAPVYVYRLPNVFGKWCKPNYNSAVATFCFNIAAGLPIVVSDNSITLNLVYIDDVVHEFIAVLDGKKRPSNAAFYGLEPSYMRTLGEIVSLIQSFKESRLLFSIPKMTEAFTKKLYSTYLSYLPKDQFSYPLKMNIDSRGSFTEFLKSPDQGQVSINVSKPGITRGNHWHHTKTEKFLAVSGHGLVRFRSLLTGEIMEYPISSDTHEVVDIPVGYTHSIVNLGKNDLVTVMWVNEPFDRDRPDTFSEVV